MFVRHRLPACLAILMLGALALRLGLGLWVAVIFGAVAVFSAWAAWLLRGNKKEDATTDVADGRR